MRTEGVLVKGEGASGLRGTDKLAVASAVCGFTAVVPVISQVAGLGLGIASLIRIRRAERCGVHLRGRGWALAGIASSGFALLSWIAVVVLFLMVRATFHDVVQALPTVTPIGG